MCGDRVFIWLCIAVVFLGYPSLVDAGDVEYDKCSLSVKALDADNIGAELTCTSGSDPAVKVLSDSDPIPVGTSKRIPGTPITFFGDMDYVVKISGNADSNTMFELHDSSIASLPANLSTTESALLVKDARLQISNCRFDLDNLPQVKGGIRAMGLAAVAPDPSVLPTNGSALEIIDTTFTGGKKENGALFIDRFPFVRVRKTVFLHGTGSASKHIHRFCQGTLIVSDSEFWGAKNVSNGNQSVALYGAGVGMVLVYNSTFTGMGRSAIEWRHAKEKSTYLYFRHCNFRNNRGPKGGVAVLTSPLNVTMEDCVMSGNTAQYQGGVLHILVENPKDLLHVQLIMSTFDGNKAVKGGSVVYLKATGSNSGGQISEVLLEGCTVINNKNSTAIIMRGAGYVNAKVKGSNFTNNIDGFWGGAIGLYNLSHVVLEDAMFKNNKVTRTHGSTVGYSSGGAVRVEGVKSMTVSGCTFKNNEVLSRKPDLGGALYVRGWKNGTRPTLTVNGTVFSGNKAGFAGGSLFVETMASLEMSEITLDSSHTIVGPGGGALLKNIKKITATNVTVKGNTGRVHGGGVAIDTCDEVTITGSSFAGNVLTASRRRGLALGTSGGGALSIKSKTPYVLTIANTNFHGASEHGSGGLLLVSDTAKCILSGSNFTQKASVSGNGGVAMMKSKDVTIESCKFVGGGAVNGGGLALTGPKISISKSRFLKSTARANGGALFLDTVNVDGSNFTDSSADGNRGAVSDSRGTANITSCTFKHTTAKEGGALAVGGDAQVYMTDTNILRSQSSSMKGGVLITLSCDAKVNAGGQCLVDIPIKGDQREKNKRVARAEAEAFMSSNSNCSSSNINVECELELWHIKTGRTEKKYRKDKKDKKGTKANGNAMLTLLIIVCIAILTICQVIRFLHCLFRCKTSHAKEDEHVDESSSDSIPLLGYNQPYHP